MLDVSAGVTQECYSQAEMFAAVRAAHAEEHEAALRQVGEEMNRAWKDLDEGMQDLEKQLIEIGIVKGASRPQGDMIGLNIGGVPVNVHRVVLEGQTLGDLFESVWDERIPRDDDGRIVIDESPVCVKHIVDTLKKSAGHVRTVEPTPLDEKAHLYYISGVLGSTAPESDSNLRDRMHRVIQPSKVTITVNPEEGSLLTSSELVRLMGHMQKQNWFLGDGHKMHLIYRASRDGMDAEAFHSRCGDASPSTLTLVRHRFRRSTSHYSYHEGRESDHVVGGFSDIPWTASADGFKLVHSTNAFIFSLKHEVENERSASFDPKMYDLREGHADYAISTGSTLGPSFGTGDLTITFDGNNKATLTTGNGSFKVPDESRFLEISGSKVEDIEVYRVHHDEEQSSPAASASDAAGMSKVEVEYVRKFGASMASALMEEETALQKAYVALAKDQEKAAAALQALEVVYGPDVVSGKKDEVLELSVRGTRITTLRSTLTFFPNSILATWFNSDWQPVEKELDDNGRRIVDCSPRVFSKVLDVLRVRKRAGWATRQTQGQGERATTPVPVVVREGDRASLEDFVYKYFPGRESFIMDLVVDARGDADCDGGCHASPSQVCGSGVGGQI